MKTTSVIHIEKAPKALLEMLRKIQAEKEARQKAVKDNWNKYFPKEK